MPKLRKGDMSLAEAVSWVSNWETLGNGLPKTEKGIEAYAISFARLIGDGSSGLPHFVHPETGEESKWGITQDMLDQWADDDENVVLEDMEATTAQSVKAAWLVNQILEGFSRLPYPIECRRIYCRKFAPGDGISPEDADLSSLASKRGE